MIPNRGTANFHSSRLEQSASAQPNLKTMITATMLSRNLQNQKKECSESKEATSKGSHQMGQGLEDPLLEIDETAEFAQYRNEQRRQVSAQHREKARRWRERSDRRKQPEQNVQHEADHSDHKGSWDRRSSPNDYRKLLKSVTDGTLGSPGRTEQDGRDNTDKDSLFGRCAIQLQEGSPSTKGNSIRQSQVIAALGGSKDNEKQTTVSGSAARWLRSVRPKTALQERVGKLKRMGKAQERHHRLLMVRKKQFMELPEEERIALRSAFTNFDRNGSCTLDPHELEDCLSEMGLRGRDQGQQREVRMICQEVLILGEIDFFTFCFELVPRVRQSLTVMNRAHLHETFETYDTDGNGTLSESECRAIVKKSIGTNIDAEGAAQLEQAFHDAMAICRRPEEEEIQFDRFEQLFSRISQSAHRIRKDREDRIAAEEGLSESEIKYHKNELLLLYDSFHRADVDGSRTLSTHEVRGMVLEHGLMPKDAAAHNRMVSAAENISGGEDLTFKDALMLFRQVRADQERSAEAALSELFKLYDRDDSGELNMVEISQVIADYGLTPRCREDQQAIKRLLDEVDADNSGTFELVEFLQLIQRIEEKMQALQFQREALVAKELDYSPSQILELRDCFHVLDVDGSGALGIDELREVLNALRITMTSDELKDLLESLASRQSSQDNEPVLNFEGFMRFANKLGYKP